MNTALPAGRMHAVTGPDDSPILNVVVAYDNLVAGQRAMSFLTSLADEFQGTRVEMRPQLWRFDLLDHPQWFAPALAEAIRADMLIVSTGSSNGFSQTIQDWLEECLARKHGTGAAIVALPGAVGEQDSSRFQFLKSTSGEAGLDFFSPPPSGASTAALPTPLLIHPASGGSGRNQPYRHWGLNE